MTPLPTPPLATIEGALSAAMRAFASIEKLVQSGAVGPDVDDLLRNADDLLAIVDAELAHMQHADYPEAFEAASVLRNRLAFLRGELGSFDVE